jgi:hypothetical protein
LAGRIFINSHITWRQISRNSLFMAEVQEYIKLKCSDCEHYKKVEVSGKRMTLQCTNLEVFKEDKEATKLGYINANIARCFTKYCGKHASHFIEKKPEYEPDPTESLNFKTFAKKRLTNDDKDIIIGFLTKGLIILVVVVILILGIF